MGDYNGSCLCGQIKFQVIGNFESFYLCHCTHCQKDTGSAFAANIFSSTAKLKWLQGVEKMKTFNLPGTRHIKSFCTQCGSALPTNQHIDGHIVVPAGSLDSELKIKANAHLFYSSKASWEENLDEVTKLEKLPG